MSQIFIHIYFEKGITAACAKFKKKWDLKGEKYE